MRKHAQLKFAGGPGSGTDVNNTDVITHLAQSKIVSLNNRRFVLATPPDYISNRIPVLKIKFAGQRNYSIVKLGKMLTSNDWVQKKVDLLEDANGFFHVIDGHHRVLAAIRRGHTYVNARVWTSDLSQPIEKTGANILRVLKAAKGTSAGPSYQNLGMAAAGLAGAGGIYYLRDKGVLPKTKKGDRPNFESMM